MLFVVVWLLGDLCNLVGASMAGLLPTVILLAVYVSFFSSIYLHRALYIEFAAGFYSIPSATSFFCSRSTITGGGNQSPMLVHQTSL